MHALGGRWRKRINQDSGIKLGFENKWQAQRTKRQRKVGRFPRGSAGALEFPLAKIVGKREGVFKGAEGV